VSIAEPALRGALADRIDRRLQAATERTRWRCDDPECDGKPHEDFEYLHARGKQVLRGWLPGTVAVGSTDNVAGQDRYRVAYMRGGRRSGKTWGAANHLAELIKDNPGKEWACVGPTFGDARDICMENVHSGLIVVLGGKIGGEGKLLDKGPHIATWNRSYGQLWLNNGGVVYCDGADDGAYRIQGHGLSGCWGDEIGLWVKWRVAFDESIRYAVSNYPAKLIVTGTPKRTLGARVLVKRLIDDPNVLNVQLHTEENIHNLDPAAAAEFLSSRGTALERQELYGDLLEEVEGALWTIRTWDLTRVEIPDFDHQSDPFGVEAIYDLIQPVRVGIAVDPAVTGTEDSDEHGIIVAAKGEDGDIYLLEDLSFRGAVTAWPPRVIEACERWQVDRVIAEVNNGGDYVEQTLRAAGYRGGYEVVRATRGKMIRAEPVATYHEKLHVHAVGYLPELQEQCHPAGTLVETICGPVPIEEVRAGDLVATRQGWAPVLRAWQTGVTDELLSVTHDRGVLQCTSWHPIYRPDLGEFVPARSVRPGHALFVAREGPSGGHPWRGAANGGPGETTAISGDESMDECGSSIDSPGWSTTDPFRLEAWSTISTKTEATLGSRTSAFGSHTRTMLRTISAARGTGPRIRRWSDLAVRRSAPDGRLTRAGSSPAPSVGAFSSLGTCELSAAPIPLVVGHVRTVKHERLTQSVPVFNLTVGGGLPEYVADGVLVHNCCTWVPGEEMDSPNRLDSMVYVAAWLRPELVQGWGSVYTPFSEEEKAAQRASRRGWAQLYDKEAEDLAKERRAKPEEEQTEPAPRKGSWFT
jgi:phage terminase large subunit-like protein